MAKFLERFRALRRKSAESVFADPAQEKDWKTVGNKFRASNATTSVPPSYMPKADEGRPPH